jgi:manganese/zinc/iron transport system permease protein
MGAAIGSIGTALSSRFTLTPAGPVIVLVGSTVFLISMLAAPRRGILALRLAQAAFARRFAEQGVLSRLLIAADAAAGRELGVHDRPSAAASRRLIAAQAVVRDAQGHLRLTESGRRRAEQIVRGRRLWQQLFLNAPELAPLYADLDTESIDALLPPDLIRQLEAESLPAADRAEAE